MAKTVPLDWDSKLFGYPVARLELEGELFDYRKHAKKLSEYRLTYVVSDHEQHSDYLNSGDSKIIFTKQPETHSVDSRITDASAEDVNRLVAIGKQSGHFSRFNLDANFQNDEFEKLYQIWVEKSIKKQIAVYNPTILVEEEPSGLITLGESDENTATIGLFAVSESFRGQGIGTKLLQAADNYALEHGYKHLTVATQGQNIGARKVYEKFGFRELAVSYIYNFWNEAFTIQ